MRSNHSVRYLDFSENAIGGKYEKTQRMSGCPTTGGAAIALALDANATLKRIDLRWNLLGAKVPSLGYFQIKTNYHDVFLCVLFFVMRSAKRAYSCLFCDCSYGDVVLSLECGASCCGSFACCFLLLHPQLELFCSCRYKTFCQ